MPRRALLALLVFLDACPLTRERLELEARVLALLENVDGRPSPPESGAFRRT